MTAFYQSHPEYLTQNCDRSQWGCYQKNLVQQMRIDNARINQINDSLTPGLMDFVDIKLDELQNPIAGHADRYFVLKNALHAKAWQVGCAVGSAGAGYTGIINNNEEVAIGKICDLFLSFGDLSKTREERAIQLNQTDKAIQKTNLYSISREYLLSTNRTLTSDVNAAEKSPDGIASSVVIPSAGVAWLYKNNPLRLLHYFDQY